MRSSLSKKILRSIAGRFSLIRQKYGDLLLKLLVIRTKKIQHGDLHLKLYIPNWVCRYRADTFSTKEPDTLQWIDSFKPESIFWDIGANVGLYSLYAASRTQATVFAFEPSIFNLEALARNIQMNTLQEKISIVPLAMNNRLGFQSMTHSNTHWGGALSSFDQNINSMGGRYNEVFSYKTLGLTLDFMLRNHFSPPPKYIKIDVDGIEHLILGGAKKALTHCQEILIELNEDFQEQFFESKKILQKAGFKQNQPTLYQVENLKIGNQIWKRKG